MKTFWYVTAVVVGLIGFSFSPFAQDDGSQPFVAVLPIEGPIGSATVDYLRSRHEQAVAEGAAALVITLDTPGGLVDATRDMIQTILGSSIPVITWVAPEGARAASAGTYLLYASHVAAMAPATNVGSATPVQMGGGSPADPTPGPGEGQRDDDPDATPAEDGEKGDSDASAMEKKIINDAVAYIRGLAEKRGRNADWAEAAVREGVNITASQALELNVVNHVSASLSELLAAVEGMEVEMVGGASKTLSLQDARIERYEPGWRYEFLSIITNPTIAYVLMMVGIYGLLLEGYSPGAILPGTVGAISLLMALYAFQLMPVNYVGLALILLGILLMIGEALAPSFGVLGFGGLGAFVLGSVLLMDSDIPGYGINTGVIVGMALVSAMLIGLTLYLLYKSRRARIATGEEGTVDGRTGNVISFADGTGWMSLNGERWQIRCASPLEAGQTVRVVRHAGFVVEVEPLDTGDILPVENT